MEGEKEKRNKREEAGKVAFWAVQCGGGLLVTRYMVVIAAAAALGFALLAAARKNKKEKTGKPGKDEKQEEVDLGHTSNEDEKPEESTIEDEGFVERSISSPLQAKQLHSHTSNEDLKIVQQAADEKPEESTVEEEGFVDGSISSSLRGKQLHSLDPAGQIPSTNRAVSSPALQGAGDEDKLEEEKIIEEEGEKQEREMEPRTIEVVEEEAGDTVPSVKEDDEDVNLPPTEAVKHRNSPEKIVEQDDKEKKMMDESFGSWKKLQKMHLIWLFAFLVAILMMTFMCLDCHYQLRQSCLLF
ncbi:uncharacterized protein LOC144706873 isoform X2 [Wolffia australiana]